MLWLHARVIPWLAATPTATNKADVASSMSHVSTEAGFTRVSRGKTYLELSLLELN